MAATCDAFPQGWDLQVTGVCFPTCGVLSVAPLDADQQQLQRRSGVTRDTQPFVGQGFAGLLEAGKSYSLRFAVPGVCPSGYIEQSFTATAAVNHVQLDARGKILGCP